MSNDLKNIENRNQRKKRHDKRALQDLEDFFKYYKNKIEVISYTPLDMKREYQEYLVLFRLTEPMKPKGFLKMLIEKVGEYV